MAGVRGEGDERRAGRDFIGSSNTYLAYKHDLEAIGTNAHELPMAMAALADNDEEMKQAQYRMLELWQQTYQGELLILLPDTFGTTQFLENAPDWVANWTGQRIDSKDPFLAGDEYIAWLRERGRDPRTKRLIASDGLDVDPILALHAYFGGTIRNGAGPGGFPQRHRFSRCEEMDAGASHSIQRGLGNISDQRFPRTAIRAATTASTPSALCASSAKWTAGPRSSFLTTIRRRWDRQRRSSATGGFSERQVWQMFQLAV